MERYKGYRVPIASIKGGSILKQLAAREKTTSDDILHSATKPDPQEPKAIGPLASTEELLEALDLTLGSEEGDLDDHEHRESEPVSTQDETVDSGEAMATTPTKKKRRVRKEIGAVAAAKAAAKASREEPRFVELTKLLPVVPKRGTFEVNDVKKSLYFFS